MNILKKINLSNTPVTSNIAEILLGMKAFENDAKPLPLNFNEEAPNTFTTQASNFSPQSENDGEEPEDENQQIYYLPPAEACNCRKSKCLKLYCQCFAGSAICGPYCRCAECENRSPTNFYRLQAIKQALERNPNAFESKYKAVEDEEEEAAPVAHKNGCRCRKSLCLKKYCECYQGGVPCSSICTCLDCHNRAAPAVGVTRSNTMPLTSESLKSLLSEQSNPLEIGLKRSRSEGYESIKEEEEMRAISSIYSMKMSAAELSAIKSDNVKSSSSESSPNVASPDSNGSSQSGFKPSSSRPPLVPLIKRRKTDENVVAKSSNVASSSSGPLTPNHANIVFKIHPSTAVETPRNIRSASPNSLSIAKALSQLYSNNYVPSVQRPNNQSLEMKTPLNDSILSMSSVNFARSPITSLPMTKSGIHMTPAEETDIDQPSECDTSGELNQSNEESPEAPAKYESHLSGFPILSDHQFLPLQA